VPDVYELVREQRLGEELYPLATRVAREFRGDPLFDRLMTRLGSEAMQEVGNLYTASLPAWLAAGLEDAARTGLALEGTRILTLGYGSGDAAEAIPMRVMPGWRDDALRIGFREALDGAIDLDETSYRRLHDGMAEARPAAPNPGVFYIDRIGGREDSFDDAGIEYYRYQA
jgi:hydroxymethylglutaryl-CoA synthase